MAASSTRLSVFGMHVVANSPPRTNNYGGIHHANNKKVKTPPRRTKKPPQSIDQTGGRNKHNEKPKLSLKRSRSLAQSTETHHLNGMQIILFADDSPINHCAGNFRIVKGVEDDQVAPPSRRLTMLTLQTAEPTEVEENSDYTLSDLFDGPTEESNAEPSKELSTQRPNTRLDVNPADMHHHQLHVESSTVAIHRGGIHTSNAWERPETTFQESIVPIEPPPSLPEELDGSPSKEKRLHEAVKADESSSSSSHQRQQPHQAEESSFFLSCGHESEISIDPLNNFSPRRSTRAKAAVAHRAANSAKKLLDKDQPLRFNDSSVRHKSFESVNQESRGGTSHYSRYDDSLLVRKSRRDVSKRKLRPSSKNCRSHDRSPPQETSRTSTRQFNCDKKVNDVAPICEEQRNHSNISADSTSCTIGNKSSSQEFAQLDLGDQQGIRMVKRAEILTEEHGGLHERKAVVDVSPPKVGGFSGILRSKMATLRSTSSRKLGDNPSTQSPPPDPGTIRSNHRPGLVLFRSQNSSPTKPLEQQFPRRSSHNDTSPKGAVMGLALRNHFTNFRAPRVETTKGNPEDKSIALEEEGAGLVAPPVRASLFSNNLLTRLNESFSNNLNHNGATLLDDDESSFGFPT